MREFLAPTCARSWESHLVERVRKGRSICRPRRGNPDCGLDMHLKT